MRSLGYAAAAVMALALALSGMPAHAARLQLNFGGTLSFDGTGDPLRAEGASLTASVGVDTSRALTPQVSPSDRADAVAIFPVEFAVTDRPSGGNVFVSQSGEIVVRNVFGGDETDSLVVSTLFDPATGSDLLFEFIVEFASQTQIAGAEPATTLMFLETLRRRDIESVTGRVTATELQGETTYTASGASVSSTELADVPLPPSLALLLGALGAVAWIARRREAD